VGNHYLFCSVSGNCFYLKTKGKENRLLGFVFSVILINNIMLAFLEFFKGVYFSFNPLSGSALETQPTPMISIINVLTPVFYIIMSFLVLKRSDRKMKEKWQFPIRDYNILFNGKEDSIC
jgi:hypothetical protein